MVTFVSWLWTPPRRDYRSVFTTEHVNTLCAMIDRHYSGPHRHLVVTNLTQGLDPRIEAIPDTADFADLPNPNGSHNPSCYRRLRLFRRDAGAVFGDRVVSMDLDTVIVGDLTPLFDRPEDFVIWGQADARSRGWYNGSLMMLRAGTRPQVWEHFNPRVSPHEARRAGSAGSDQGWIGHILGRREATWSTADGVYSYRVHVHPTGGVLPANARIVNWHGKWDPWSIEGQRLTWVREHYGVAA